MSQDSTQETLKTQETSEAHGIRHSRTGDRPCSHLKPCVPHCHFASSVLWGDLRGRRLEEGVQEGRVAGGRNRILDALVVGLNVVGHLRVKGGVVVGGSVGQRAQLLLRRN